MTGRPNAIEGRHSPVFYLEIPPSLFGRVVEGLAGAGLTRRAQVVVEKPFGHDLASARALNAELRKLLEEWQIFRIDHFLGKEPAMDILFLRFANSDPRAALEPRSHPVRPDHHGRGLRRGGPGQLLRPGRGAPRRRAEPPTADRRADRLGAAAPSPTPTGLRDKRVEVFRAIPPADPQALCPRAVRRVPRRCPGVSPGSQTETFAALRLEIDNWRWSGVPFFIRAGKSLADARHRDADHLQAPAAPGVRTAIALRTPTSSSCGSIPNPAPTWWCRPRNPEPRRPRTVDLSLIFAEELGDAARALRTASRRRPARRCQPLHPRGQRGGDVAHRAATAGRATSGGALRPRDLGAGRRGHPACRAPALA